MNIDLSRLPELTPPKLFPLYADKHRHLHLYGTAGSGKSRFVGQKYIVRILSGMQTGKVHTVVALRKTSPAARRSVFTLFDHYRVAWGLQNVMARTDMQFTFPSGSRIICAGLDDPTKLQSIEGVTSFWLEEATEFTRDDLMQIRLRLRGGFNYLQTCYTYNPNDMTSPLYEDIYRQREPMFAGEFENGKALAMHCKWEDNPFLDEGYKDELRGLKDKDDSYYQIYACGLWGARKALIYHGCYTVVGAEKWPAEFEDECYGLDFGFNNPTALVHVGINDAVPYVEQVIYESHLTNGQLIEKMRALGVREGATIWADNAEPARIQEISDAGYDCRPADEAKKPNAVRGRIDFVKGLRPRFHADSSDLLEEAATYKWKEDPKSGVVLDEPVKFRDHAMNALEYACFQNLRGGTPGVISI